MSELIKIYIENKKFWNHIVYTFETLLRCIHATELQFYDVQTYKDDYQGGLVSIFYGKTAPEGFKGIVIQEGSLFSEIYMKKESEPRCPLKRFEINEWIFRDDKNLLQTQEELKVPVLFLYDDNDLPGILETDDKTIINFDIIQSSFYLITGYEEILHREGEFDIHSRYPIEKRLLYKEKMLDKPIVNIYAKLLEASLKKNGWSNEERHTAFVHISHDVDVFYLIKHHYIRKIFSKFGIVLPYKIHDGFEMIMKTEREYKLHSSWYFMSGGNNSAFEKFYDLSDSKVQNVVKKCIDKGDEIGWHYSYNSSYEEIQMRREFRYFEKCMGNKPVLGRNHFLRYTIPESWRMYEKMGLVYDTTLASAYHEGFVYGICTPFILFDAIEGRSLGVWEIPLIVMDGTLTQPDYRGLTQDNAMESVKSLIDEVKKYDGVFSILWHNSSLRIKFWKPWEQFYKDVMKMVAEELTCATGMEIIRAYSVE